LSENIINIICTICEQLYGIHWI